jgi:DNA-binding MarR family transcriptional regulator
MKIEDEIQQRTFKNEYQKAGINLIFTASWLDKINADSLKPFKISIQQFNILRILRGMAGKPASVKLLTERMLDKMSNASRLVEKLKQKGLVERIACPQDRRQVDIFITDKGLKLLEKASDQLESGIESHMSTLSIAEAEKLNALLDQLRG